MNVCKNLPDNVLFYGYNTTKSGKKITVWEVVCFNCSRKRLIKRADHAKSHAFKPCKFCSNKKNHPQGNYRNIRISFLKKYELSAKARNKNWAVTLDDLANLADKQNRKCALTGLELNFTGDFNDITASLDRINNLKGYKLNNLQWVHKKVNMMKGQLNIKEFIDICKLVTNRVKW